MSIDITVYYFEWFVSIWWIQIVAVGMKVSLPTEKCEAGRVYKLVEDSKQKYSRLVANLPVGRETYIL